MTEDKDGWETESGFSVTSVSSVASLTVRAGRTRRRMECLETRIEFMNKSKAATARVAGL